MGNQKATKKKKTSKKDAVHALTKEQRDIYERNIEMFRGLAISAIYKVFPSMRNENLNECEDLINICLEKVLYQMAKFDPDKALNTASKNPRKNTLTAEQHIANKNANPEEALNKAFAAYMRRAMKNKLLHVLQSNPSHKYKMKNLDIRSVPWAETMEKVHQTENGDAVMGTVRPDDELFGRALDQAAADFDYMCEVTEITGDETAGIAWMNSKELTEARRDNLMSYMKKHRLQRSEEQAELYGFTSEVSDIFLVASGPEIEERNTSVSDEEIESATDEDDDEAISSVG